MDLNSQFSENTKINFKIENHNKGVKCRAERPRGIWGKNPPGPAFDTCPQPFGRYPPEAMSFVLTKKELTKKKSPISIPPPPHHLLPWEVVLGVGRSSAVKPAVSML